MIPLILIGFCIITFVVEFSFFPLMVKSITNPFIAKEVLSMVFAISIFCYASYKNIKFSFKNPFLILSLLYLVALPYVNPSLEFGNKYDNLIYSMNSYFPLMKVFIYFLMFLAVSNFNYSDKENDFIIKVFCWIPFLVSLYCIIQFFNCDQWTHLNDHINTLHTKGKEVSGTLGHPNQCGIFLSTFLPFLIYKKRWIFIITVLLAILATKSDMALIGVYAAFASMFFLNYKSKILKCFIIVLTLLLFIIGLLFLINNPQIGSGRVALWAATWDLLINGPSGVGRIITGYGFGSFKYMVGGMLNVPFVRLHFDLFQYLFATGLIGLSLLIFSIIWLIKENFNNIIKCEIKRPFFASFLVLIACSFGSFVFQVDPLRYIGVFLLGYLHRKEEIT